MLRQAAVRIPKSDFPIFRAFLLAPIEDVRKIAHYIKEASLVSDIEDIAEACASETSVSEDLVEALLLLSINLSALRRNIDKPVSDMLELVSRSLALSEFPDWEDHKAEWEERQSFLADILSPDGPIEVLSKVRELLSDHQRILLESKVLTDIRYVYSTDAQDIRGGLITYSINLQYLEDSEPKHIHVSLAAPDIAKIIAQLQRAQSKAETATKLLKRSGVPELTPKRNI